MANMPFVSGKVAQTALQAGLNDDSFGMGYKAQSDRDMQKAQADAKLAELIKGKELEQQAIAENMDLIKREAAAQGLKPGKYSMQASVSSAGFNPETDPLASAVSRGMQQAKKAQITGYNITDPENVVPTAKDQEETKAAAQAVKQLEQFAPGVKKAVDESNFLDRFGSMNIGPVRIGTEAGRGLEQQKTALLDYARSLSNTGVLQPGEIPMLERRIGDITGVGSMFRSPDDIQKQLAGFGEQLKQRAESMGRARGYTPQEGYLTNPLAKSSDDDRRRRLEELRAKRNSK